ncbi:MAG: class II fructose-bisphosphate aldolase [Chloroflexi bacterium]|nr:class II fructose-bisphosphate aldolase [Chloroflexota bacterium]
MATGSISIATIDSAIKETVFCTDKQVLQKKQLAIRELALNHGIYPASIQGLYEAAGKGLYSNKTVPAMNIRGITYQVARAVFKAAIKDKVGPFIFEIARSEIGYTKQTPAEYATCIFAAAIKEGYKGPVFIQGDHFQVSSSKYGAKPEDELNAIKELIKEAVAAGFYNIDIDASTVVDLKKRTLLEQQEKNYVITADMTKYIRSIEPNGVTISVGGEIGEVGGRNSTVEDLKGFMTGYIKQIGTTKGISKISVQTGTTHGGVVLPDGSIASVEIDFKDLEALSTMSRKEYKLAGAVQHGASTLPDEAFDHFPRVGTAEVHLATGFQNIIYDSKLFPKDLSKQINKKLNEKYAAEKKVGDTEDQFLYKTRKKAFGDFKEQMWDMPEDVVAGIRKELEDRFSLLFHKLNVTNTVDLVNKYVKAK